MEYWDLVIFFVIGFLGYITLFVLGPMARVSASKGGQLLPSLFRCLAVMVIATHIKIHYLNFFGIDPYRFDLCLKQTEQCAIAKVVDSKLEGSVDQTVFVKFHTEEGELVKAELDKDAKFYVLPKVGDEIVIKYTYMAGRESMNLLLNANLPERYRAFEWICLIGSALMLLFVIWMEAGIRNWHREFRKKEERRRLVFEPFE